MKWFWVQHSHICGNARVCHGATLLRMQTRRCAACAWRARACISSFTARHSTAPEGNNFCAFGGSGLGTLCVLGGWDGTARELETSRAPTTEQACESHLFRWPCSFGMRTHAALPSQPQSCRPACLLLVCIYLAACLSSSPAQVKYCGEDHMFIMDDDLVLVYRGPEVSHFKMKCSCWFIRPLPAAAAAAAKHGRPHLKKNIYLVRSPCFPLVCWEC